MRKPRTVFVACRAGTDLSTLLSVFQTLKLKPLNIEDAFPLTEDVAVTTFRLIDAADLICAILPESPSPNTYFEMGYALALKKPLAIISGEPAIPIHIPNTFWIRAELSDSYAL